MSKLVTNIESDGKRFGYIVHTYEVHSGVNFFGKEDDYLQSAVMLRTIDEPVLPHFHNRIERQVLGTSESIFLCSGSAIVHFYNEKNESIGKFSVFEGDLIVFIDGGHGIDFLESSKLIEIKQGPYLKNLDKTIIQVKGN